MGPVRRIATLVYELDWMAALIFLSIYSWILSRQIIGRREFWRLFCRFDS
ncbi:hypothetical protein C7S16_4509 [Burkholderia thailandensis]|uniref:Uncharacterized protein n=1 Tax=Burkholderia thailandensis TaxID=57975 RepID=A0AAW9CY92_BURTH|nr:hypothetical protein [Burkholderia thailandensis]MDW9253654.1 hypothetical protein [Burkholderia thailandensis]